MKHWNGTKGSKAVDPNTLAFPSSTSSPVSAPVLSQSSPILATAVSPRLETTACARPTPKPTSRRYRAESGLSDDTLKFLDEEMSHFETKSVLKLAGLSTNYWYFVKTGRMKPTYDKLKKICDAIGLEIVIRRKRA